MQSLVFAFSIPIAIRLLVHLKRLRVEDVLLLLLLLQANLNLQNFDVALEDFKAVLEIDPENKAARNQITVTNQKKKQLHEREKQMYSTMFQKMAASEPKKSDVEEAKVDKKDTATRNENGGSDGSSTAEV